MYISFDIFYTHACVHKLLKIGCIFTNNAKIRSGPFNNETLFIEIFIAFHRPALQSAYRYFVLRENIHSSCLRLNKSRNSVIFPYSYLTSTIYGHSCQKRATMTIYAFEKMSVTMTLIINNQNYLKEKL